MDAYDIGFTVAVQDAIAVLQKAHDESERMAGCHYTAMSAAATAQGISKNRASYEFYKGKCAALADALQLAKFNLQSHQS